MTGLPCHDVAQRGQGPDEGGPRQIPRNPPHTARSSSRTVQPNHLWGLALSKWQRTASRISLLQLWQTVRLHREDGRPKARAV